MAINAAMGSAFTCRTTRRAVPSSFTAATLASRPCARKDVDERPLAHLRRIAVTLDAPRTLWP